LEYHNELNLFNYLGILEHELTICFFEANLFLSSSLN
jgi:hypothetical protein